MAKTKGEFEVGQPYLISNGFWQTCLKDKGNLLAVYLHLRTRKLSNTIGDSGVDYVTCGKHLCAAIGKEDNYPAFVAARNALAVLIEHSKELCGTEMHLVEPQDMQRLRTDAYIQVHEQNRDYMQGFCEIFPGEVQAILESDFKRKPDLSIVFFTIVSRIRPRKSGDDPKERPEACSISVRILCEFTGLSELRVSKAVRELKKLGVLCALTPTFPSRKDGNYVSLNTVYARGGHEDELNAKVKLLIHGKKTDLDF